MKKHKTILIITLVLAIGAIVIIALPFVKTFLNDSDKTEIQSGEKFCENPYKYNTEYMPIQIPSIQIQDGDIDFQQISNITSDTDKIVDNLYTAFSSNRSEGIKDCYCEFDEDGNVFFSRISEDDYDRYLLYKDYTGEKGENILFNLENMPEHRYKGTGCVTFQKDIGVEIALLTTTLYSNVPVNVLMSKDFSQIKSISDHNVYQELKKVYSSQNASKLSGTDMATIYHYQQSVFRPEEENITEEQFVYYTYFKLDNMEYIVQYTSNYTLMEGQKEYRIVGDLHSQEECRNTLISVLSTIINSEKGVTE